MRVATRLFLSVAILSACFATKRCPRAEKFDVILQWTHLNYTWRSPEEYEMAVSTGRYVPLNNAPTGIKIYKNTLFISVPRFRPGVPATLASVEAKSLNPLLVPFPSWEMNDESKCTNLQSVQSMEIDSKGTMWVLDGARINGYSKCPAKLLLFDLTDGAGLLRTYTFSNEISLQDGGFLNDLVIDETDGEFAYATDNSQIDPGLIVYSRSRNKAWKLRDASMYPQEGASRFEVNGKILDSFLPLDGIALSPKSERGSRRVYYCAMGALNLYSIPTKVLKDSKLIESGNWRRHIVKVGQKLAQSDGLVIDNEGSMFYTLLPYNGVARWSTNSSLWSSEIIDQNKETMVWPDGFAFDESGYIYLITNYIYNFIDPLAEVEKDGRILFRVHRYRTGTKSYLFT